MGEQLYKRCARAYSVQFSKASSVCDFYGSILPETRRKDFIVKSEVLSRKRHGKREYLNRAQTRDLMNRLYKHSECKVDVPGVRIGKKQKVETLISEEALLFVRLLRDERNAWIPRIAVL